MALLLGCFGCSGASGRTSHGSVGHELRIPVGPGVEQAVVANGDGYWKLGQPMRHSTTRESVCVLGKSGEELFLSVGKGDPWKGKVSTAHRLKESQPEILVEEFASGNGAVMLWGWEFSSTKSDRPIFYHIKFDGYSLYGSALLPEPSDPKMDRLRNLLKSFKVEG